MFNWKNQALKVFLASVIPVTGTLFGGLSAVQADPVSSLTAPEILPHGLPNGKKVLFDNTHGQTAGAADWVIDGGFSDFANALADKGYDVKELRKHTPITYDDLKQYDVFIIGEANIPYKKSEQDAMLQYVRNSGAIFFIADHYNADRNQNRWDASEVFNGYRRGAWNDPAQGMTDEERNSPAMQGVASSDWLGQNFGIRFRYNALGDLVASNIVSPDQSFGITNGVSSVAMHAGATLAILDPNKAKGLVYVPQNTANRPLPVWSYAVEQGMYENGGVAEGPFVAISKVLGGKAAFIGDSSAVEDSSPKYVREDNATTKGTYDGWKENNDATLMTHLVDWLATKEGYPSLAQAPGHIQLDQQTPLLPMEDPAASTEPQPEPWGTIYPGYKWYDNSTFKPGSYGAMVNWVTDQDLAVTGTWNVGAQVTVTDGGTTMGESTVDQDGNYAVNLLSPLPAGTVLTVQLTDPLSGLSKMSTVKVTPVAPTFNPITDKSTGVTGTAEPGDTVYITQGVGSNVKTVASAPVQPDGTFQMSIPLQYSGKFLTLMSKDANGNSSFPVITTVQDTTAPSAPVVNPITDTGTYLSGKVEKGTTVTVKANNKVLGITFGYYDGSWGLPIQAQFGGSVLTVSTTDQAGNVSPTTTVTVPITDTSLAAIDNMVVAFGQTGDLKNAGVQQPLQAQLAEVQAQLSKGHQDQAVQALQKWEGTVNTFVTNGNITAYAGNVLLQNAAYLLTNGLK